jgi:hypothetical protein
MTMAAVLCGVVTAQHDEDLAAPRATITAPAFAGPRDGPADAVRAPRLDLLTSVRTPIHTAADDPDGGAYGIWAGGATYKVSFHDGFRFVPYLGAGYPRTQSFAWRTVAATVGGAPLGALGALDRATTRHDDHRFEYHWEALVEAYDVLVEGCEQTFVVAKRPAGAGDLVVSGEVTTALRADLLVDRHAEIVFRDERGHAILHYGRAFAIDARGDRIEAFTSYDGRQVHLRVPGAWLETAQFPVTIDPLLTRDCVGFWNTANPAPAEGRVEQLATGRDDLANQTLLAYTRAASATDTDMWIYLFTDDSGTFAARNLVFSDVTTSWGTISPAIAFGGGNADSYICAFIRANVGGPGVNGARYHLRASGDVAPSTAFSSISRPGGSSHGDVIDVGGVPPFGADSTVFVVFERDDPGSHREVWGRPIDLDGNVQGTDRLLDSAAVGTSFTRRRPNINQVSGGAADGWVVAWQEYWDARGTPDDWDINIRRIDGAGTPVGGLGVPSNSTPDTLHKLAPRIDGARGRYGLVMTTWAESPLTATTSDLGTDVFCETFDWPAGGNSTFIGISELTGGLVSDRRWRATDSTFDSNTASHWAVAFESTISGSQYACTVGFDAGRIERPVAHSPAGAAVAFGGTVHFDDDANRFFFAYASDEAGVACGGASSANHPVYVHLMTHLAEPAPSRYGTGCGPASIGWSGRPLAGVRSFSVDLSGAPGNVPAVLLLNFASGAVPLDLYGMTGCLLNLSPFNLIDLPAATSPAGSAAQTVRLFTNPTVICGDLYWQWAYFAPGLNPLGVGVTQGLRTRFTCP